MADAKVKNMLKQFEQSDGNNMSAGRGKKPDVAVKPVLQRFPAAANSTPSSMSSSSVSSPATKPLVCTSSGQRGVRLMGLGDSNFQLKSTSSSGDSITNDESNNNNNNNRRVSVPKVFQNGGNVASSNDSNNNSESNKVNGEVNSSDSQKPPIVPKFPKMSASNIKPEIPSSKPEKNSSTVNQPFKKTPLLPKTPSKSGSVSSTSSSSSSVSTTSHNHNTTTKECPTSPSSSSSPNESKERGKFDFKKQLRPVDPSSKIPGKRVLSRDVNDTPADVTSPKSPISPTPAPTSPQHFSVGKKPEIPLRHPPTTTSSDDIEMRSKQGKTAEEILERKSDGKKFRKLSCNHSPNAAPQKPPLPDNVDLTALREEYQKAKNSAPELTPITSSPPAESPVVAADDEPDSEVYWDGESQQISVPPPTPPKKTGAETKRESQRVSMIPDMSPEEEGIDLPVYDDTPIEEELYDDAESVKVNMDKSKTEPKSPTETDQERKKRLKEEANAKRKEEKERKEKEKKEKEEEKKRKKKEEEEIKMKKTFNITGNEKLVGEGIIKQDSKASGLNLKVTKGQIVTIVRLDQNPKNKWLIKIDEKYGYVDSQNIEVDPNIIRQAMTRHTSDSEEFDQPTYDDVPEEMNANDQFNDDEMIYEECS